MAVPASTPEAGMADEPIEIELDNAMPWVETLPDGRRAVVIRDEFQRGEGPRALLILPHRDGWLALHKLHLVAAKLMDEERAAERGRVWRGGRVIVGPDLGDPVVHGTVNGPGMLGPVER